MPAGTKVAAAESAIRSSARKKGMKGDRADRYVYGALNKAGFMHGNKATRKGLTKMARHPKPKKSAMVR